MPASSTIFGLMPFEPKRLLILPCEGGEITLYVADGVAHPAECREVRSVLFCGWGPSFENDELRITENDIVTQEGGYGHCNLEVTFRLLTRGDIQTTEIVAISLDEGVTWYDNHLCTLGKEYDAKAMPQAG